MARRGRSWSGTVGRGSAWFGMAGHGGARQGRARFGRAGQGTVRHGQARLGVARRGTARFGKVGCGMVDYPRGTVGRRFVVEEPRRQEMPTVDGEHLKRRHEAFLWTVRDMLEYYGWRCFVIFDSRHCPAGYPDVTAIHDRQRRVIWVECKTGDATLTPDQRRWRDDLLAAGQEWFLLRPQDGDLLENIAQGVT